MTVFFLNISFSKKYLEIFHVGLSLCKKCYAIGPFHTCMWRSDNF